MVGGMRLSKQYSRRLEIFLEFLIFGVVIGIAEDLLAIWLATDEPFTWKVVLIAVGVAVPFAFLGEVIVDRIHLIPVHPKNQTEGRSWVKQRQ